jgi:hypothetical protein
LATPILPPVFAKELSTINMKTMNVDPAPLVQIVPRAMACHCQICLLCLGITVPPPKKRHRLSHAGKVTRHRLTFQKLKNDVVLWLQIQKFPYATPQMHQMLTRNVFKGKSTMHKIQCLILIHV